MHIGQELNLNSFNGMSLKRLGKNYDKLDRKLLYIFRQIPIAGNIGITGSCHISLSNPIVLPTENIYRYNSWFDTIRNQDRWSIV